MRDAQRRIAASKGIQTVPVIICCTRMLGFAGIKPIHESFYGLTFADERKRARWIEHLRTIGSQGG